jgi:outer membrane protein assembly factor BamA
VEFDNGEGLPNNLEALGASGSEALGAELAAVYDSRNNLLNATQGLYLEFTYGVYEEGLGSSHTFNLTRWDLRYYQTLSKRRKDVLAFQFIGHVSSKDTPLAELAFFGGPEIMRGYYEGRFIDRTMLAAQIEYRTPLWGRFGAVAFAGAGNVKPELDQFTIGDLDYSVGLGLRFLLDRRENLNLRFDWGFGEEVNNYYFNIAEAF